MNKITKIAVILKPSNFDDLNSLVGNLVRWFKRREIEIHFSNQEEKRLTKVLKNNVLNDIFFADDQIIYKEGQNEFYEKLNSILFGKYEYTTKSLYEIQVTRNKEVINHNYFFNDIVFSKNDIARMFTLSLEGESEHIFNLTGDGLIISSTYGSTAYSLAAGGPIVHPDVAALILTPICAHSLTHRPMVVPDSYKLRVGLIDKINSVHITLDGQVAIPIEANDFISIQKSDTKSIRLIMNTDRTYFHTLKEKFVHGRKAHN